MSRLRFHHFAWGLLFYNIPVVLWGAYVRASRSGDGCGDHWPSCGGEVVPTAVEQAKTWVEYGHRISTGILLPIILLMLIAAFVSSPKATWCAVA
jgi:heme A synthase